MSGGGCLRRRMSSGRGAEVKPSPVPGTDEAAAGAAVDLFAQARKALSYRSPFDAEEAGARVATLPSALSAYLSRPPDGRRKHKKSSHGDSGGKPSGPAPAAAATVWDVTEEYFRPVTLADIDALVPKLSFGPGGLDSYLSVPICGNAADRGEEGGVFDTVAVEVTSNSAPQKADVVEEERVKEADEAEAVKEEQSLEIDGVRTCDGDALPENAGDDSSSLNWLLGSKERFVLASERPNKKRKLLGGDAGLEKLIVLPNSAPEAAPVCDFCCLRESGEKSNRLLCCDACNVSVHPKCYGVYEAPERVWLCSWCKHLRAVEKASKKDGVNSNSRPCLLCPKEGGALKPVGKDYSSRGVNGSTLKFAHLFCSLWMPEVYVEDTGAMEPIVNVGGIQETRKKLVCNVCKVKHGACVRCSHGTCRTSFHPICARESKHQMEIWGKFGCGNVELRAFCSKHSACQDNSLKHSTNPTVALGDDSPDDKPPLADLPVNKIPKLRLTRKNRDNSMMQEDITTSNCDIMVKNETNSQDALAARLKCEGGQAEPNKDVDASGVTESDSIMRYSPNLAVVLKKLIDRGKISVGEIASEMGISANSFQAALVGETTTFSPGLRLKIIKWLQNSVHTPAVQQLKVRSGSAITSDNKVGKTGGSNAAKVNHTYALGDDKVTSLDPQDAVLVKSLPPRRRTKSNIRILKDNKVLCSSGVTFVPENGNGKIVDETGEIPIVLAESSNGDTDGKRSSLDESCNMQEQELSEMILEDASKATDSSCLMDLPARHEGNSAKMESNDLSEAYQKTQTVVEGASSFEVDTKHVDGTHAFMPNALLYSIVDSMGFGKRDHGAVESSSDSYIHPFIKKKLMQMQNHVACKQRNGEVYSNVSCASLRSDQQPLPSICTNLIHTSDAAKLDQLSKAKSLGILEFSPEDEVEGEIVYLQARLLDNAVEIKQTCEDLMFEVVHKLPQELDKSNKQKWDLILVNQFLREVREARKRGRKERKHKEAQAVLAAAAAAVAGSSRNMSLRVDTNDEINNTSQESPLKVNVASGRAGLHSSSLPRIKESSRSTMTKVSSDKFSGIFQMPDFSKENALYCDICLRTETVLNRIFVCSSCKVAVHLDCYRRLKNPIGSWKCEPCEEMSSHSRSPRNQVDGRDRFSAVAQCGLCGRTTGAFRKSTDGQWVHAFCAEWILESSFRRGQENAVEGMDTISKGKDYCCICLHDVGVCLKCSYGHCQSMFHASCARAAGFYMNTKAVGARLQHKAYCDKHSMEQREADIQQYGVEELKSVKQIRVELEKLRLLCERIIKREKLKRDLVLCSHDMLASRRDYVAYSMLVRSSFFAPGASSESATTSINNRSYSGTMQRSDDVTVDSTVVGKRAIKLSLHKRDIDRSTDDSSTSQLSFKRKFTDRSSFAGKQLPHKSASIAFRNLADDGEKKSKARKHTETFQKELVMTSDQASMQNQRLPKGFAYVPIGCLSREKPLSRDSESCEPREPGG